jgi:Protein of unknown function (DUF1569)
MKNLFDTEAYNEIISRLNTLNAGTQRKWGKMNAAQMLAHCAEPFIISLSEKKIPRPFVSYLFGWMAKRMVLAEKPYKPGLPTAKQLIIKDERDFETEKKKLCALMEDFYRKPEKAGLYPHPFFGSMTKAEWGKSMYKHMDHHLRQFGA